MVRFKAISTLLLSLVSFCFGSVEEQLITVEEVEFQECLPMEEWESDLALAKQAALEKGCPILVAFLGPNWCSFSDQLEKEVLVDDQFLSEMKKRLVLLKVDLPEVTVEDSPAFELKERYQLDQCPSIALIEPSGKLIAKLPHLPCDAKGCLQAVQSLLDDYAFVSSVEAEELSTDQLQSVYVKAGQLADKTLKETLLSKGLKKDESPYFLVEEYGELLSKSKPSSFRLRKIRHKIALRDPKNQQGFLRKVAMMDFEALASVKKPKKADKVVKPLVRYLKKFGAQDVENAWQIEMKISQYLFGQNEVEGALKHARASLEIAPDSAKEEIAQSIEYLEAKVH